MDKDRIIVYKHFQNPVEAHIIKTKLESCGIPVYIENEIGAAYSGGAFFSGGKPIRLKIFERDLEKANEALANDNEEEAED